MIVDPYFTRSEVSNSDLSALKQLLYGYISHDPTHAYAFGSLLDAMITEPVRVDYYYRQLDGYQYTVQDFERAKSMKAAFCKTDIGKLILQHCSFQHVSVRKDFEIEYSGFKFSLDVRCKWDFIFPEQFKMGGDIKSTSAETLEQFIAACDYFDYFRSRAWYMDIAGTDKDMLIGVSKVNDKVFQLPIARNDKYYNKGKEQYQDLSFKYWMLMADLKTAA